MTNEDMSKAMLDFHARLVAHEDIMRALVTKVARENTQDEVQKLDWIKEVHESVTKLRLGMMNVSNNDQDNVDFGRDVMKWVDRFFKPFR